MSKVYIHRPGRPEKLIGIVKGSGQVYRFGPQPDNRVGHVELHTGRIYRRNIGPDEYLGQVDLKSGEVFDESGIQSNQRLGVVREDGRMFLAQQDEAASLFVGYISHCLSVAYAGAAFLLLVLPVVKSLSANGVSPGD